MHTVDVTLAPANTGQAKKKVGGNHQQCQGGERKLQPKRRGWAWLGSWRHSLLQPLALPGMGRRPSSQQGKAARILEAPNRPLPTAEAEHAQRVRNWDRAAPGGSNQGSISEERRTEINNLRLCNLLPLFPPDK